MIKQVIRLIVLTLLIGGTTYAADSFFDNTHGWISMASLWGQGGAGLSYRTENFVYSLSDFFMYDISEGEMEYNEVELLRRHDNVFEGIRLRYQMEDYEIAPFIGRHDYFSKKDGWIVPFSLHNELEWRQSPYDEDSYLRSQHGFTVFSPKKFFGDNELTPFASIVSYVNWEDVEFEKTRVYVGYSMKVSKYKFSLYYIPWRDGKLEKEWDDQMSFGASIKYIF